MKCTCCNSNLSDFEATRRHAETQEFLDLCSRCLRIIEQDCELPVTERDDLHHADDDLDDDTIVLETTEDAETLDDVILGTVHKDSIDTWSEHVYNSTYK